MSNIQSNKKTEMEAQPLVALLDKIFQSSIPDTYKQKMSDDVSAAFIQHIIVQITEKVPEDQQSAFAALLENNASPVEIDAFLRGVIVDYEQVMGVLAQEFFERLAQESGDESNHVQSSDK